MKRILFIAGLLLTSFAVQAQKDIYLGVRGGLNIPKLTASGDNPMSKGYSSQLSGNSGIFAEFRLNELFSLQPMVEYTRQGGSRDGMQAIPAALMPGDAQQVPAMVGEKYLYADFKSETSFDYIMVPVLAKFGWNLKNTPVRVFVSGGPFVSFLLKAKQKASGNSHLYVDPAGDMTMDYLLGSLTGAAAQGEISMKADRTITDEVQRVNYGVSANIGASYAIAPRHNLLLEVGANYGFRKLQKSSENGQNRIGALTVTVGYAYKLK
ncbi:MAG: PorT family protein [Bacteroides sp.]|nr:PorT family protein [Bacteroides sp.]